MTHRTQESTVLTNIVLMWQRIQIRTSQWERRLGRNLWRLPLSSGPLYRPSINVWPSNWVSPNQKDTPALMSRAFTSLHYIGALIGWLRPGQTQFPAQRCPEASSLFLPGTCLSSLFSIHVPFSYSNKCTIIQSILFHAVISFLIKNSYSISNISI